MRAAVLLVLLLAASARGSDAGDFPLGDLVDTRIGSGGSGFGVGSVPPGAQVPFGSARAGPDTQWSPWWGPRGGVYLPWNHCGGYYAGDTHIRAFSHTHLVGAGVPDYGNIGVMPSRWLNGDTVVNHNAASPFSRSSERGRPGHYSVFLETPEVTADIVAGGAHSALHRYTFPADAGDAKYLLIDVCHNAVSQAACHDGAVEVKDAGRVVTGWVLMAGSLSSRDGGGVRIYFHAVADEAPARFGTWAAGSISFGSTAANSSSGNLGAFLQFGADSKAAQTLRVGISWLSEAHAEANLRAQLGSKSFDEALHAARATWEAALSVLQLPRSGEHAAPREQLVKLYSALYRTNMAPSQFDETPLQGSNGAGAPYLGFDSRVHHWTHGADSHYYTDMSLWDTHRSKLPWLALTRPRLSVDIMRSLHAMAREGGDLPRWPLANRYTNCMVGNHGFIAVADNVVKGNSDFDVADVYSHMKRQATQTCKNGGRNHVDFYNQHGFIANSQASNAATLTLAYAFDDWAVSQVAAFLGKTDEAAFFANRSRNYEKTWSPQAQLMCPRKIGGGWNCPNIASLPYGLESRYTEGNALQYSWFAPQDPEGLLSLHASHDSAVAALTKFFALSRPFSEGGAWAWGNVLPNGYYWAGNEPSLFAVWMFSAARRPDLTAYWSRMMLDKEYGINADGLPGNDDYGTMSAWQLFASLGFYPQAGSTRYLLGAPVVPLARLRTAGGTLTVRAHDVSDSNIYVQRATLNGKPLTEPWLHHADLLAEDAQLQFWMGDTPSNWGQAA
eukprot:PLAT12492.40.p2 GENE.PLAT12492.40~~PLAT12492.40.p2  ORF type:complete len:785 (+),score=427.60 PLAT12492.40:176-2530(+)